MTETSRACYNIYDAESQLGEGTTLDRAKIMGLFVGGEMTREINRTISIPGACVVYESPAKLARCAPLTLVQKGVVLMDITWRLRAGTAQPGVTWPQNSSTIVYRIGGERRLQALLPSSSVHPVVFYKGSSCGLAGRCVTGKMWSCARMMLG